jgi:hypothetical protein
MSDDTGGKPQGEPEGRLPAGAGMTGPFGQDPDRWKKSPTPAGIAAFILVIVIVVVVVILVI